ncbi:IclR family transcriptional regulator domain-containing protein [Antarcticimicrobium luteum]|uniref:IclR family transcriptional regulator n=1 Tax=Antarcticimicrobium luteum TaxID=2547397 RepID=A0A4R5VGA5_9RHOB|nr:helix-turn-helix domain-containing protein [Antarcticimicrobium luteum]TDK52130.1 IclR family transcriptional regulator [Antarcticimicrobium luteum]
MPPTADSSTQQDRNIAATFAKGMAVLEVFDGQVPALTLSEIARLTGQDRATARRGALTLVHLGYLRQDGRHFSLTPRVLTLAGGFLRAHQIGRQVQPVLNHHAAALGVEITLASRDGDHALLLAQSTAHGGPISYGFTPGSRLPLLHTSLGRMLLAGEAPDRLEGRIGEAPLTRFTEQSLTDPAQIAATVAAARQAGYVITDGEFEPGIVGIAVAVAPHAVLGSSVPRGRDGADGLDAILRGLQNCASELRLAGALSGL